MTAYREQEIPRLLTAAEVAARLGVTRAYVYEHASDLGAIKLGNGQRPRLRFDPRLVGQALRVAEREAAPAPSSAAHRQRRRRSASAWTSDQKLLPIKGAELR